MFLDKKTALQQNLTLLGTAYCDKTERLGAGVHSLGSCSAKIGWGEKGDML